MEKYLNGNIKSKVKGLAYYQIIGGLIGLGLTVSALFMDINPNGLFILSISAFTGLFCFSILCGLLLLKQNLNPGLKLSTINHILQVFTISIAGYSFKYAAGLILSLGIDLTDGFDLKFHFSAPSFQLDLNSDKQTLFIGINFIAIYLVYYIDKLQKQIGLNRETRDASP